MLLEEGLAEPGEKAQGQENLVLPKSKKEGKVDETQWAGCVWK